MRALAGILAYMAVVMIAVIILINEWIKRRKNNFKWLMIEKHYQTTDFYIAIATLQSTGILKNLVLIGFFSGVIFYSTRFDNAFKYNLLND